MRKVAQEIQLYLNPKGSIDRKTLAIAKSVTPHVQEVEYHKTKISTTTWRSVLDKLDLRPKDLMNRAHPYYQEHIAGRTYDDEGWLNILVRNPDLIKAPIAVRGSKARLCENPADVLQLGNE